MCIRDSSSTTSRGTTYLVCACAMFLTWCAYQNQEKQRQLSNEVRDKLDPRSRSTRLSTWQWRWVEPTSMKKLMASKRDFFTLQFDQCKRGKLRGSSNESTSKQTKNAQKQEEEVKPPKHFKQAKGLRHLKQGRGKVSKIHHVSLYQIPKKDLHISTIQHSHFQAFQLCHISTSQHLEEKLS